MHIAVSRNSYRCKCVLDCVKTEFTGLARTLVDYTNAQTFYKLRSVFAISWWFLSRSAAFCCCVDAVSVVKISGLVLFQKEGKN